MHHIQTLKCFSSHLSVSFAQFIEARCLVEDEDVVGAALTGGAPATPEWSTILLPTKVQLVLEVWCCDAKAQYATIQGGGCEMFGSAPKIRQPHFC